MTHDSYSCDKYPDMEVRPFPVRRDSGPNNFIGSVVKENISLQIECPGVNVINLFSSSPMFFLANLIFIYTESHYQKVNLRLSPIELAPVACTINIVGSSIDSHHK
jgi:hypothetical protein